MKFSASRPFLPLKASGFFTRTSLGMVEVVGARGIVLSPLVASGSLSWGEGGRAVDSLADRLLKPGHSDRSGDDDRDS
jgi:hypothetical protein